MGYYKITIRPTDRNYSLYVRRDGECKICGRTDIKLEACHYHGRGKESTRFDDENVWCLCFNCHKATHENKSIFTNFLIKMIGIQRYDLLTLRANTYKKRDDELDKIIIKEKLKSVGLEWK